jgi:hypothetical protein
MKLMSLESRQVHNRLRVIAKISAFLILVLSININLCQASVVWSDNFDDGDLEGWKISGASYAGRVVQTLVVAKGNCSTADKTLRETSTPKMSGYSYVAHSNGVNKGTWSFDAYYNEGGTFNGIPVIFNFVDKDEVTKANWMEWHGYEIRGSESGSVGMTRMDRANGNPQLYGNYTHSFDPSVNSWHHFDITYNGKGRFMVYVDNELCLDLTDTKMTDFDYIGFWLQPGPAIDNVVVSDEIIIPSSSAKSTSSMRVTVKDSSGKALSSVAVSSTKQPGGQTALSGVTEADGSIKFTDLTVGDYTLQVVKSGYVPGSALGTVSLGAMTEISTILQVQSAQPTQTTSGGVPGFPVFSVGLGLLICALWLGLTHRSQMKPL